MTSNLATNTPGRKNCDDAPKLNTANFSDGVLLISGSGDGDTGGGLCALDGGSVEVVDRISTAGLAFFDRRLARLMRTPLSTGGGEILIYDERGVSHYLRVDELSDPHSMVWNGHSLIVSSTGANSLIWVSLAGEVVRRWRAPGEDDSWHLNDVCIVDNHLYACALGKFGHYRAYKDALTAGSGLVFDVADGRSVVSGLCAPHSPRYFDGAWTVCDSLRHTVVQFNPWGQRTKEAKLRGFTRGMAVTDEYLVVGESAQRRNADNASTGSVTLLRRAEFSFVARYELPFREISEVTVVPRSILEAAKTGFRTNPLRVAESDQLQMFRNVGIEPRRLWAVSERLAPSQCAVRVEAQVPSDFTCGRTALVECEVVNVSDAFLCSEMPFPVFLCYRWKTLENFTSVVVADGIRTPLPQMLPPGGRVLLRADVQAPAREGEFELVITLVQEHVAWFDDIDASNACSIQVDVSSADSNDVGLARVG